MRWNRKAMLAAGLLAGAALMTGCAATAGNAGKPTQKPAQQQTAQPETDKPETEKTGAAQVEPTPETAEGPALMTLLVNDGELEARAAKEEDRLLLPLIETAQALGWKAQSEETAQETHTQREITLEKEGSRITVSYEVSDNTIRKISWQKDGLLIPVDTDIRRIGETIYVPSAFFEEAMGIKAALGEEKVEVSSPEPIDTPQTNQ